MTESKINQMLEAISTLPLEDQEFIINIVIHRIHEAKRAQILLRAKEAEANYRSGNVETGTIDDLIRSLESD